LQLLKNHNSSKSTIPSINYATAFKLELGSRPTGSSQH